MAALAAFQLACFQNDFQVGAGYYPEEPPYIITIPTRNFTASTPATEFEITIPSRNFTVNES